jgi:hypothetical protein
MAFEGAGSRPGLELWRVEAMDIKKQPPSGKFHTGDSYVLLSTKEKGNALTHDVHFWLGAETSTDEAGVAAIKAVELDDALGGGQ